MALIGVAIHFCSLRRPFHETSVIEVISFAEGQIEASPDIGVPWRSDYIRGVVRRDAASGKGGFVVIFDLARLLTSQDAAYIAQAA